MVVYVVFSNGSYIGCYDSPETAEKALSKPGSKVSKNDYYLNIDNRTYEILADTMVTESNLSRSN